MGNGGMMGLYGLKTFNNLIFFRFSTHYTNIQLFQHSIIPTFH